MSNYFSKFPTITYNKVDVKDITRRSVFLSQNLSNPYVFLPYTIKENEKPEDIAYYYYGSVDYTWLVLLSNNIIDPYYEWPLDENDFNNYLIQKYETISGKKGYEVIDWLRNETLSDNIAYYYKDVSLPTPAEGSYTVVSDLDSVPMTEEQIQELFDNELVTINGIQYRLVRE